ncbi:hypothetical protein BG005_002745 [Podila minutissima]|nr:hypothetical protein BG005_002745 [Podila minutissima]
MMLQSQMPIHHHMPTINDEDPFGEYVMMENMPGRLMNDNTMDEQVYGFNIPTSPDVNTFKGPSVPNPVWTLTAALQKPGKAPKAKKTTVRPPRALECFNCKVTQTPLWRRTLDRKHSLCNACGLYYKQYNGHRPLHIRHKPSLSQSQRENASPYTLTPNAQKKDSASSSSVSSPESAKVDDPDTGSDPTEESDTQTAEPTKDSDQEASSETLSFEAKAEVRSEETSKSLSFKEGPRVKRSSSSGNSKSQKMQSRHRQTRSFTGPIHTDSYMGVPIGFAGHLPQGQQDMTYSMASGMAQMIGPMVDDSYRQALYQQHTSGFMVDESHRESPLMGEGGPFSPASSLCSPLTNATVSPLGHGPMAPYTLPPTAMPGLDVSNNPTPTTTAPTINSNSNEQVAQSITPKSLIFDDMRFQVFVENMRPKQMVKFLNVLENRCHVLRNRLGMPALTLQNHQQMNHPSVMTPTTECGFQSLSLSSPVQEGLGYPWPGHQPGFQGNGLYMYANNDEMMMDHQIIGGGRDEGEDTEDESVQFSSGSSTVVGSSGIESKFWHSSATSVGLHATE